MTLADIIAPQSNQRGIETRCGCSFLSEEVRDGTLCRVSKLREYGSAQLRGRHSGGSGGRR